MEAKFRGGGLEKKLFHGTRPEIVDNICKENFDWRLYGRNATVYGQGSYFAQNASYSDRYATDENNFTSRFMFLADVLVGSYVEGDSSMRRPPPKNPSNPTSDLYDSCVDDERKPKIFVVFDNEQCYPCYVIEYTTLSQVYGAAGGARYPQRYTTGIQTSRASGSSAAVSARASQPSYGSSASSAVPSARVSQPSYGSSASSAAVSARASQPSYGSSGVSGSSLYSRSPVGTPSYHTPPGAYTPSPGHQSYYPVSGFSPPPVGSSSGAVPRRRPTSSSDTGADVRQSRSYSRSSTPSPQTSSRSDKPSCIVS